jgi:hypothetical protein
MTLDNHQPDYIAPRQLSTFRPMKILKQRRHVLIDSDSGYLGSGGSNPDFSLLGDSPPAGVDSAGGAVRSAIERDAVRFACDTSLTPKTCVIIPIPLVSATQLTAPVGTEVPLSAGVVYIGPGDTQVGLPAVPVRWKILAGTASLSCGASPCFSATCDGGTATVLLTSSQPGEVVIGAAIGPPLDPADCASDMDRDIATITVSFL